MLTAYTCICARYTFIVKLCARCLFLQLIRINVCASRLATSQGWKGRRITDPGSLHCFRNFPRGARHNEVTMSRLVSDSRLPSPLYRRANIRQFSTPVVIHPRLLPFHPDRFHSLRPFVLRTHEAVCIHIYIYMRNKSPRVNQWCSPLGEGLGPL